MHQRYINANVRIQINDFIESAVTYQPVQEKRFDGGGKLQNRIFEVKPVRIRDSELVRKNDFEVFVSGVKVVLGIVNQQNQTCNMRIRFVHGLHQHSGLRQTVLGNDGNDCRAPGFLRQSQWK